MLESDTTPAPKETEAGAASSQLVEHNSQNAIGEPVNGETAAALDFLVRWSRPGPWMLTAIQVAPKRLTTRTFDAKSIGEMEKWIDRYNGARNIYFQVNPTLEPLAKKARQQDIRELAWLHVDVDPRAPKKGLSEALVHES